MTDSLTPEERSRNMSAIRSRDTGPEIYFRRQLFALGFRYRIADRKIPGHPDLYLRRWNVAIFVHGCFWHRHQGCKNAYTPKSDIAFWTGKFEKNIQRDIRVREELKTRKIRQITVWECTVRRMKKEDTFRKKILEKVTDFITDGKEYELEL